MVNDLYMRCTGALRPTAASTCESEACAFDLDDVIMHCTHTYAMDAYLQAHAAVKQALGASAPPRLS